MPENAPNTFDECEQQVRETLNGWSAQQRTAFAAALAERWLLAYQKFSVARNDPQIWQDQHRLPEVHNEIMQQMMLLMKLQAMPTVNVQSIELLSHKR